MELGAQVELLELPLLEQVDSHLTLEAATVKALEASVLEVVDRVDMRGSVRALHLPALHTVGDFAICLDELAELALSALTSAVSFPKLTQLSILVLNDVPTLPVCDADILGAPPLDARSVDVMTDRSCL